MALAITAPRAVRLEPPTLAERIARLEAELSALRQQWRDEGDACLLRAIVNGSGLVFTVREVFGLAARDPELRAALAGLGPRQLAKRFVRLGDRTVEGLSVRRVKLTASGWFWAVQIHDDAGGRG